MAFLEVNHFSYTYPGEKEPVLRDINLSISAGAFTVIIGKSGSGKSTLGKALAGFLFQDEMPNYTGEIFVNGSDMTKLPIFLASEHVAYVQQNSEDQFCTLTVQDEIAFGLENLCVDPQIIEQRITEVLEVVQGSDLKDRDLTTLSGGEKQKIAIASLLALQPDVLILDEPTSNLDPIATKSIFETLYQIRKNQELTVIIIEHKLSQLLAFKPEIFKLESGEIIPQSSIKTSILLPLTAEMIDSKLNSQIPSDPQAKIILSNINVTLGEKQILTNINLSLYSGEFAALMGPNGSGKSTLLETLMGFHSLQSGENNLLINGPGQTKTSALVSRIGYIFQNPDHQLFTQSIWNEATFTSLNLGLLDEEKKSQAKFLLEKMGLGSHLDNHPQRLSYGEKRRLNLVSAMLHSPEILLIDELLIGQDLDNAQIWMSFLQDYAKHGRIVLLVNHHADLTRAFCDRIIFLDQGKILIDQPIEAAFLELADLGYQAFLPFTSMEKSYA